MSFFLIDSVLRAQEVWVSPDYLWEEVELEVENKLLHRKYQYMTADEAGYVWVARNGIQRYDGLKFRSVPGLEFTLQEGEDITITPGPGGRIWYGRHSSIGARGYNSTFRHVEQYLIDPQSMEFSRPEDYFKDNLPPVAFAKVINVFCQNGGEDCYLGLSDGRILRYDAGVWRITDVATDDGRDLLQHLAFAKDGHRWAIYPNRCYLLDSLDRQVHSYPFKKSEYANKAHFGISIPLAYSQLVVLFHPDLLPTLPSDTNAIAAMAMPPYAHEFEFTVPNGRGITYCQDIDYPYGLITDDSGQEIVRFSASNYENMRLVDRLGRYWFSTYDGFLVGKLSKKKVQSILDDDVNKVSARGIISTDDKYLWINTYKGLFKMLLPGYGPKPRPEQLEDFEYAGLGLNTGPEGTILSGMYGHQFLTIYPAANHLVREVVDAEGLEFVTINLVVASRNGALWALENKGLSWKPQGGVWTRLSDFGGEWLSHAEEGEEGMWISGNWGLRLFDVDTGKLINDFPALKGLRINHFSRRGDSFYLATEIGVVLWDIGATDYRVIDVQTHGLPKGVHAVYLTDEETLFFSTNHGVFRFNLLTGVHLKITDQDGLPDNECNRFSHFRGSDGMLYFGTIQGVGYFYPDSLNASTVTDNTLQLRYDDVQVFSQGAGLEEKEISEEEDATYSLTLAPNDVLLRVGLSLPYNVDVEEVLIRYRLATGAGDAGWIIINKGVLQLNRPSPGEYLLEIEAVLANGIPVGKPPVLQLTVLAPVYQRTWFVLSGTLMTLLFFLWLLWTRKRRYLKRQEELAREVATATVKINEDREVMMVQNKKLTELNEDKRKLLSVIAHDLKGPFTSLQGVGQKVRYLLKLPDLTRLDELSDDMETIVSKCLATLNNLLLANGADQLTTKFVTFNLVEELEGQLELLEPVARMHKVIINFSHPKKPVHIRGIPYAVNSLFHNLTMNAIKFADAGGSVLVRVTTDEGNKTTLTITDRGVGMEAEDIAELLHPPPGGGAWKPTMNSTGLGWRVVRMVAELHGATLAIISTKGEGTTVTCVLSAIGEENMTAGRPE